MQLLNMKSIMMGGSYVSLIGKINQKLHVVSGGRINYIHRNGNRTCNRPGTRNGNHNGNRNGYRDGNRNGNGNRNLTFPHENNDKSIDRMAFDHEKNIHSYLKPEYL